MKKILYILFAGVGLLLYSCGKDDNGSISNVDDVVDTTNNGKKSSSLAEHYRVGATANYMEFFFKPQNLELELLEDEVEPFKIAVKLFSSWNTSSDFYCCYSAYPDSIRLPYYDYAEYYGDTTYWQSHTMTHNGVGCIMPLKSISVVADKELDEAHPAGTPINDLLDIGYSRIYSYIKGGYTPEGANDHQLYSISPLATFEGDFLFPEESRLIFKKKPSFKGRCLITVAFTFDKDPVSGESIELPPTSIVIEL